LALVTGADAAINGNENGSVHKLAFLASAGG